jgi:hypothetical protein
MQDNHTEVIDVQDLIRLADYREANRARGWRATADLMARHIREKATPVLTTREHLDQMFINGGLGIVSRAARERFASDPVFKSIEGYARRLHQAVALLLFSFDDRPEDIVAAVKHMIHHGRVLDFGGPDPDLIRRTVLFQAFMNRNAAGRTLSRVFEEVVGAESPARIYYHKVSQKTTPIHDDGESQPPASDKLEKILSSLSKRRPRRSPDVWESDIDSRFH